TLMLCCFFFQAEDGIRDLTVTGVQTCALPIYGDDIFDARRLKVGKDFRGGEAGIESDAESGGGKGAPEFRQQPMQQAHRAGGPRSEERRVGKEWRARWARAQ